MKFPPAIIFIAVLAVVSAATALYWATNSSSELLDLAPPVPQQNMTLDESGAASAQESDSADEQPESLEVR